MIACVGVAKSSRRLWPEGIRKPSGELFRVIRDALAVTLGCAAIGIGFNAIRTKGIALIQKEPYAILVPCPDLAGEVSPLAPEDALLREAGTLVLDARSSSEYQAWHVPSARHLPFDYLEPVPEKEVRAILSSGAARVVVYGDGSDPDSGRELAKEIAAKGVRNVFHLTGGAPALGRGAR
jgi:hypothetical protein